MHPLVTIQCWRSQALLPLPNLVSLNLLVPRSYCPHAIDSVCTTMNTTHTHTATSPPRQLGTTTLLYSCVGGGEHSDSVLRCRRNTHYYLIWQPSSVPCADFCMGTDSSFLVSRFWRPLNSVEILRLCSLAIHGGCLLQMRPTVDRQGGQTDRCLGSGCVLGFPSFSPLCYKPPMLPTPSPTSPPCLSSPYLSLPSQLPSQPQPKVPYPLLSLLSPF